MQVFATLYSSCHLGALPGVRGSLCRGSHMPEAGNRRARVNVGGLAAGEIRALFLQSSLDLNNMRFELGAVTG